MSESAELRVVRRLVEIFNSGDAAGLREIVAEECELEVVGAGAIMRGPDELAAALRALRAAFPDLELVERNAVASGRWVAIEWRDRGTHLGPYRGYAPTGRRFVRDGCSVAEVRDGKLVALRDYVDPATALRQLGLVP